MAPNKPTSLLSCNNPACSDFGVINEAVLKCGKCQTITYCNQDCQRAHWSVHKQFCKVWRDSAAKPGEGVRDIKKLMGEFLWLIRGVTDYVDELFKEYIATTREGRRGCIEFLFKTYAELAEAVRVVRNLPVVGEHMFHTMPNGPGHQENPDGMLIELRRLPTKRERIFNKAVDRKMAFSECGRRDRELRPNLINLLNLVGTSERTLVICVTMLLKGMASTHSYDFLFKELDWYPEEAPEPERLALLGPDDSPPLDLTIDMD